MTQSRWINRLCGCQGADFSAEGNQSVQAAGTSIPTSTPTLPPPVSTCTSQTLLSLYNTAEATLTASQGEIATACIDQVNTTEQDNLTMTDNSAITRFTVTCATRWCLSQESANGGASPDAVGLVISSLINTGGVDLNPNASVQVKCFYNQVQPTSANNACLTTVNSNPPLQQKYLASSTPTACGSSIQAEQAVAANGPQSEISCGTAYCQSLGQGFQFGVLTEIDPLNDTIEIQCSMSNL